MISLEDLAGAFGRNVMIIKNQAEGLTHAESLMQLPFQGNCLNWVVGHIAANRDLVLEALGEPSVLGQEGARYKRGSEMLLGEGDGVLPLEMLLARLDQAQERITAALGRMDEAAMAREIRSGERATTVGQWTFFLYFHESYHVGQTELLRQLTGKNDRVI